MTLNESFYISKGIYLLGKSLFNVEAVRVYLKSRSLEGVSFKAFAILSMVSIFTAPGLCDSRR